MAIDVVKAPGLAALVKPVRALLKKNQEITAIKLVRERTEYGLKEAKDFVAEPGTACTEATALRRPSSENASAANVTSRPETAILVLSSAVSFRAEVERAARSDSSEAVLDQAAMAQKTTSGIVPGHHLLLHLKNPCIRHPAALEIERKQTLARLSNPK